MDATAHSWYTLSSTGLRCYHLTAPMMKPKVGNTLAFLVLIALQRGWRCVGSKSRCGRMKRSYFNSTLRRVNTSTVILTVCIFGGTKSCRVRPPLPCLLVLWRGETNKRKGGGTHIHRGIECGVM